MIQNLLIVDDSPLIHTLVRARLNAEQVRIESAESGARGIELARATPPDLILLDVDMPEMDGFEVCARLKSDPTTKSVPIVFLTAASTPEQKLRGLELGATDYIAKPFDPAELKARVRACLRSERIVVLERRRSEVLEMIAANRPLPDVLLALVEMAEQSFANSQACAIVRTGGRLDYVAPHLPEKLRPAVLDHWPSLLNAEAIDCDATAQEIVCSNPTSNAASPVLASEAAAAGLQTCWMVPIRPTAGVAGDAGVFAVFLRGQAALNSEAQTVMEAVAKLASVASQHCALTHQLAHMAHHDGLTGLPNRVLFEDRLAQGLARLPRTTGIQLGLFCIDIDRFKHINDTLGHDGGDAMLIEFARRASVVLRPTDTLARIGGDEFMLVVSDLASIQEATDIASRVMDCIRAPFRVGEHDVCITASIGFALAPEHGATAADLEKKADLAMYRAKSHGRNACECFKEDMLSSGSERIALEAGLREAAGRGELELHYQPQFDGDHQLIGFETLVRWKHPTLGLLPPGRFIPLAEETGLIVDIGTWVLNEACRQSREWQLAGFDPVKVAVNVSAVQIERPNFVGLILAALRRYSIEPRSLELELTETLMMKASPETIDRLRELRALGISISLDDFGTGHSSLAYLHQLPIDCIKTDRSFMRRVSGPEGEVDSTPVLEAILRLGHSLGMKVLAEGVEQRPQLEVINHLGFDAVQGYFCGKPATATTVRTLLRRRTTAPATAQPLPLSA